MESLSPSYMLAFTWASHPPPPTFQFLLDDPEEMHGCSFTGFDNNTTPVMTDAEQRSAPTAAPSDGHLQFHQDDTMGLSQDDASRPTLV